MTNRLFYIQTLKGPQRINKVSLMQRQELSMLLNGIYQSMVQSDEGQTFAQKFDEEPIFAQMCKDAVSVCGLDPNYLDIDALYTLLLPHNNGEEVHANGILAEINFENGLKSKPKNKNGNDASIADVIASLWHVSKNLQDAIDSVYDDRINADLLMETLESFNRLANPTEYAKTKIKRKAVDNLVAEQKAASFETEELDVDTFLGR